MALSRKTVQPVDPVLTQFMIDYRNNLEGFVADKIFPIISDIKESGTYFTFTSSKDSFTLPSNTRRAPGALYGRGQMTPGSSTYKTEEDGWEMAVDKRLQDTASDPFKPFEAATRKCSDVVDLRREYNVLSAITNATTFASYTAAIAAANRMDNINSDPIDVIDGYIGTVRTNCGRRPNLLVLAWNAWMKLKNHPVITDIIKVTQDRIVTPDLLAAMWRLDKILIPEALYNSAEENKTVSLADIMSKKCFLAYANPTPQIDMPSVGYCLQAEGFVADSYYEDQSRSDIVRARVNEVHKIVAADCGYLLTTVIS